MPDLHNIRLPAGWYPDPSGADHRRWWDGKTWTQHVAPFQKPVPVYDVIDLIEPKSGTAKTGPTATHPTDATDAATSDETAAAVPAPRRIRTAARLGRGLAALAHRLPFGLPEKADDDAPAVEGPPPAPPAPPARGRRRA